MLGIHAKNVLWDITNCARVDAASESSDQGHSEVKGQIATKNNTLWYHSKLLWDRKSLSVKKYYANIKSAAN